MGIKTILRKVPIFRKAYGVCYETFFGLLSKMSPMWFYQLRCRTSPLARWLDLKHPKTYADKQVWLNFYWRHPLKSKCADKYEVRQYAKACGCEEILIPLIGVWDNVDEIDFEKLPNKFALKCNHGCGCNIICRDKSTLDIVDAKYRLNMWLKKDYGKTELHYSAIKPRIVCEELLDDGVHIAPVDYKLHCLSGKFFACNAVIDRIPGQHGAKEVLLDRNWNRMMLLRNEEPVELICEKPDEFDKMVEYAEILAKPFPVVRVDFYYVNGRIYLGELTFTSAGGLGTAFSKEAQNIMGRLIELPDPIK